MAHRRAGPYCELPLYVEVAYVIQVIFTTPGS